MAATIGFDLIKELSVLSQGRAPEFIDHPGFPLEAPNGPPTGPLDGVDLQDSILALASVQQSQAALDGDVVTLTIGIPTVADVITLYLGGKAVEYTVGGIDDADAVAAGLAALIVAFGLPELSAAASPVGVLTVTGNGYRFPASVKVVGVTGVALVRRARRVHFQVWILPKGDGTWCRFQVGDRGSWMESGKDVYDNAIERYQVAGFSRLYVEVLATDGTVDCRVGPCILES